MRVVVLGAGIAGLAVADSLARTGADTTVLEAAPFVGGLASGFRDRGYTFDHFSHRLWTRDQEVLNLVEEWVGSALMARRKVSRIFLDSRLYHYPVDLRDLLAGPSAALALRALSGYASACVAARPESSDFRSFLVARYGEPIFDTFFGPYAEKLCGCPAPELSADLAADAVPAAGFVRQIVQRIAGNAAPWDEFLYPPGGFMELPQGMARSVLRAGGRILLAHTVRRIRTRAGAVCSIEAISEHGALDVPADIVVSTIPLAALLSALDRPANPDVLAAVDALRHRSMVCVYLGIRRERVSRDHWIYVSDPEVLFNRLSETANYSERLAPAGRTGICAEIACDQGDAVWRENDRRVARRVVRGLLEIGLLRSPWEVEARWVRRFPSAYPVYRVGYREQLDVVEAHLRRIRGLEICGRQGAFWYGSTAQGIRQALDLAARIVAAEAVAA